MKSPPLLTLVSFYLLVVLLSLAVLVHWWRPKLWPHLLAVFWGALTGFIDLHSREPQQLVVLMVLAGYFFLAANQPRRAWVWPLWIVPWIPIGEAVRWLVGLNGSFEQGAQSLFVAVPAAFGAAVGAWLGHRALRQHHVSAKEGAV